MLLFVQIGYTSLFEAAANNRIEMVELLLNSGADVNAKSNVNIHVDFLGLFFSFVCFSVRIDGFVDGRNLQQL